MTQIPSPPPGFTERIPAPPAGFTERVQPGVVSAPGYGGAPPGVSKPNSQAGKAPGTPFWSSAAQGVAGTLSLGLDDEIGAALDWLDNGTPYAQAVARQRELKGQAFTQHPGAYIGGGLGGAIATAPLMPVVRTAEGAGWAAKGLAGALTAGGYGGIYGFNEGQGDDPASSFGNRIENAGRGALLGAGLGAMAPYLPAVAGRIPGIPFIGRQMQRGGARVGELVGGLVGRTKNIPKKAAMRVNEALRLDAGIKNRNVNMLAQRAPVVQQARDAGAPMVLADTGEGWTRSLLQSSTNTSPEGRAIVGAVLRDRFEDQTGRAVDFAKSLFRTAGDNEARIEGLRRSAEAANRPAYDAAYRAGSGGVWSDELADITASDRVQRAMRAALPRTRDEAVGQRMNPGSVPGNPFVEVNGRLVPRVNADGSRAVPNLQYWDLVQRRLRQEINVAKRAGRDEDVRQITALRTRLLEELDSAVPAFKQARAGAAAAFGAEDAFEAGQLAIRNSGAMSNQEMERRVLRLQPPERALFREGAANELITDVSRIGDNRNITNTRWWNTLAGRERVGVIFGKPEAAQWEAFGRLEDVMNSTRQAVTGQSSTARQLQEIGLAGAGAFAAGFNPFDPSTYNMQSIVGAALAVGARRGMVRIDERTSREVGRLLASGSGDDIQKAADLIARNPGLMVALRNADDLLLKATRPAGGIANTPFTSNVGAAYAAQEDERNGVQGR